MVRNIQRFWEIDFLRGIAIIMMIIYHIFYDINFLNYYNINLNSIQFQLFLFPIGAIFLLLVGISLFLSYSRVKNTLSVREIHKKFLFRGFRIFCYGLIITLATWLFLKEGFIIFGILHCIGISIILAIPFLDFKKKIFLPAISIIIIGIFLRNFTFNFYWLLWLGFIPINFFTVDYFPLLPWFGVVLIGILIGKTFYSNYKRSFKLKDMSIYRPVKFLCFLGRYSLIIYLLHQPIIIIILTIFFK